MRLRSVALAAMNDGAEVLASALRAAGLSVAVQDSRLLVSGSGLAVRELGAPGRAPAPVVGPLLVAAVPHVAARVAGAIREETHG